MSQSIPGKPFFPALPRLSSRGSTLTTVARGTALWERLEGKPRGKASRESHRSLDPREGKPDTAATAGEESARACPHSRRGLTLLGRLQKYPKIHVSTGEESSGSGTDSTQGLRPQHRRERNPERPPCNSHGDWPFLRPPERVPVVPIVRREHPPQLEKIQEVLPSRRDEAHFHWGVSRLITPNLWNFQKVLYTLAATQEVPRHTRLHSRISKMVPPTSTGGAFPPRRSRWGILSFWGPAWGIPPMAKVMRKEAWHAQRRDQASGNPLFPSIEPQNQSLFYALTYTSDFTGALPHNCFSRRRSKRAASRQ